MTEPTDDELDDVYFKAFNENWLKTGRGDSSDSAGLRAVDRAAVRRVLDALESWVLDPIDTDPTRQTLMVWIRKMRGAQ